MRLFPRAAILAALSLLALLAFAGSLGHGFTNWDDDMVVTKNVLIRRLDAGSLREMFTPTSIFVGNWAPVTILSYAIDHALWGLRPAGYHLTNMLLHAVTAGLLFLLLCPLLGRGDPDEGALPAAIAAALFALHPVQVESVAWVAERKNVLGMALLLAAFLAWRRATRGTLRVLSYAAFLLLMAASLLAKAQAVILPPLLVLHEWIERPRTGEGTFPLAKRLVLLLPAFAIAFWVGWVTVQAQGGIGRLRPVGDLTGAVATAPVLLLGYVRDLLLPLNRSAILQRTVFASPWHPVSLVAWTLVAGWALGAIGARRARPHFAFFSLWFLGALVPVLNFIPLQVLAADRYQYWAAPGLFALAGLALRTAWTRLDRPRRNLVAALGMAAITFFAALTVARVAVWRDSVTLWTDALRKTSEETVVRTNLGAALIVAGRPADALDHLRFIIRASPRSARLRVNLGVALLKLGRLDDAIGTAREAATLDRRSVEAWLLLGTALEARGYDAEAVNAFRRVLALEPNQPAARVHLRALLRAPGDAGHTP